jgi:DNA-binding response OmpR family regulator
LAGFSPKEIAVLNDIANGQPATYGPEFLTLTNLGIIHQNKIVSKLLASFIVDSSRRQTNVNLRDGLIYFGNQDVSHFFSTKQNSQIQQLLLNNNSFISREQMANILMLDNFSDWSLDQAVRRLRRLLISHQIPSSCITTLRGRGYLVHL